MSTTYTKEVSVEPLNDRKGAVVRGIDATRLAEGQADFLRAAWRENGMLILKDQELDEDQQRTFAGVFGQVSDDGEYGDQQYVSNVAEGALTPHGELAFHTDNSWSLNPLRGIMLHGIVVPPPGAGGETLFADVRLALALLPASLLDRIRDLRIVHSYPDQTRYVAIPGPDPRPGMPTSTHPVVMSHPVTGQPLLFCSPRHFDRFEGLDADEGLALAQELATYIDRPEIIYKHQWSAGDLVIWDNLLYQHARTNFDRKHRRHLRRTQIGAPAA